MADQEIHTANVKVPNDELEIQAYLAYPTTEGSYPAVVVMQEIFGINTHIREVTERIAKVGYVAIAPALFQRVAPDFETGYTPQDLEIGKNYAQQTKARRQLTTSNNCPKYAQMPLAALVSALAVMLLILLQPCPISKPPLLSTVLVLPVGLLAAAPPPSLGYQKLAAPFTPFLVWTTPAFQLSK